MTYWRKASSKVSRGSRTGTSSRGNARAWSQSAWKDQRLFNAAEKGDLDILRKLTADEYKKKKPKIRWTLLHYAAYGNQAAAAQLLLEKIDPNETNAYSQTAAHQAALQGNTEVLDVLLSNAKLNKDKRDKWKCKYNDWLAVHLYEAVESQDKQYIMKLLQLKANPDYVALKLHDGWPTSVRLPMSARQLAKKLNNKTLSLFKKDNDDEDPDGSHDGDGSDGSDDSSLYALDNDDEDPDGSHDGDGSDGSDDSSLYALDAPQKMNVITTTKINRGPNIYKMDTVPRGYVSIINYKNFHDPPLTRNGSEQDVKNLKRLFTQMGYKVGQKTDLTEDETMHYLRSLRRNRDLESLGCLVMFIMSHGIGKETFITKDMRHVSTQNIISLFHNDECPMLKGKPKLFFFHFCRGDYHEQQESPKVKRPRRTEAEIQTEFVLKKTPPRDIWCVYSTTDGFYALRHQKFGSPFSVAWYHTLSQHAHENDLGKLETLFCDISNKTHCTTVSEFKKFDFKEFYFNPTDTL
ncbi:uncharacterized protein [Panulirus ornatus]|uniref:uncharacterized protein isoform X2 n=1 Tax=Panulirus ornatus TaxID=150431 RepID=UPI003A848446